MKCELSIQIQPMGVCLHIQLSIGEDESSLKTHLNQEVFNAYFKKILELFYYKKNINKLRKSHP